MTNVTVLSTPTEVLPGLTQATPHRWVSLQNQSAVTMYLSFDGAQTVVSPTLGYQLVAGATLNLTPDYKSSVADLPIFAIVTTGTGILHVQTGLYAKQ